MGSHEEEENTNLEKVKFDWFVQKLVLLEWGKASNSIQKGQRKELQR